MIICAIDMLTELQKAAIFNQALESFKASEILFPKLKGLPEGHAQIIRLASREAWKIKMVNRGSRGFRKKYTGIAPGWEFYRLANSVKKRDWISRWIKAGVESGYTIGDGWTLADSTRMIAMKDHPIWDELGSSKNFEDGTDQNFPPFAFNSGMFCKGVSEAECERLGILEY